MNSLLSNPLKSIIFIFHWQLRMKTKRGNIHRTNKKVEEKYAAYRQLHPEKPELDDYDVMEEEIYRWLFKTIDELPPRCKKIFLLHLDGKKQRDGGNVSFWGFKIKKNQFYFTHFYSFPVFIMSSLLPNKRSFNLVESL